MIAAAQKLAIITTVLSFLFLTVLFISALLGTAEINFAELYKILTGQVSKGATYSILMHIRLPRILMAACVGGALSVCGVVMQSLLRNPLAEPFVLGISSGAALGAILFMLLGQFLAGGEFLFSFAGGILTLIAVLSKVNFGSTQES